jgi:hypothetical protein
VNDLRSMPWWTPADRAELDLLVHELVDEVYEHRQNCDRCPAPCPWVNAAIERVTDWRRDRMLRSRAAWLRAGQDRLEAGA